MKEEKPLGKVIHYFSHIGVAVVKLDGKLAAGDEVRIVGGEETDFNQTIDSMEVDHKKVEKAKSGDEVGMKVNEKVREGYKVYKV
jgi:putative protease